jgi:NAD(P)H-hydrate epimerase
MIPVLTAAEMREADRRTIEEVGVPGLVLMENAGAAVAAACGSGSAGASRRGAVRKGNNGGDGFVAARHLLDLAPGVYLLARRQDVKGRRGRAPRSCSRQAASSRKCRTSRPGEAVQARALDCDLLVDAILGTGLREAPSGLPKRVIADLAEAGIGGT